MLILCCVEVRFGCVTSPNRVRVDVALLRVYVGFCFRLCYELAGWLCYGPCASVGLALLGVLCC
jgi:hypothetical protein